MPNAGEFLGNSEVKRWLRRATDIDVMFTMQVSYAALVINGTSPRDFLPTIIRYRLLKQMVPNPPAPLEEFFSNLQSTYPELHEQPDADPDRLSMLEDKAVIDWFDTATDTNMNENYVPRIRYFVHRDALGQILKKREVESALTSYEAMRQLLHRGCAPLEQWFRLQGVPPAISSGSRDQPRRPDETPADTPHNLELDPKVIPDSERSAAPESSSRAYGLHRSDEMAVDTTDDGKDDTPTSSDDQLVMTALRTNRRLQSKRKGKKRQRGSPESPYDPTASDVDNEPPSSSTLETRSLRIAKNPHQVASSSRMAATKRQKVAPRTGAILVEQGETSSSSHQAQGDKIWLPRSKRETVYVQVPSRTLGLSFKKLNDRRSCEQAESKLLAELYHLGDGLLEF